MKRRHNLFGFLIILVSITFIYVPSSTEAGSMNDYCINPPFIVGGVNPNLLLMFDNSSSMYDLTYIDEGMEGTCSVAGTSCFSDADCPAGETCDTVRLPSYCYDETYVDSNIYAGYFDEDTIYRYVFANMNFDAPSPAPDLSTASVTCTYGIDNVLCINIAAPLEFIAKGNYLNWLTSSKLDVQKNILTGGKYVDRICSDHLDLSCTAAADCPDNATGETCVDVANFMQKESRGCVGRRFIKGALTADFQNFTPAGTDADGDGKDDADPNTSLGITFAIKGPTNPANPSALSSGGQTYIDIFEGDYSQFECQQAVDAIEDPAVGKQAEQAAIEECINYTASNQKACLQNPAQACNVDADCLIIPGSCKLGSDGICGIVPDGVCATTTNGVCTPDNGVCTNFGAGNKLCVGGGKDGASCVNNRDCEYSECTAGDVGKICSVNVDCNLDTCTNPGINFGNDCVVHSECDSSQCIAGRIGESCRANAECNTGICITGPFIGPPAKDCFTDLDCSQYTGPCLMPVTTQIKSTFMQSLHSCYQFRKQGLDIGLNEIQQIANPAGCNQMYREYKICNGGANDGKQCIDDAGCPGGGPGSCQGGPDAIRPGSPVLVCGSTYTGYCASTTDNWFTTDWNARQFPTPAECIRQKYREFCGDLDVPPVVDPTDDPSDTSGFDNLPAILNDVGIEAQLGEPIATLRVQVERASSPEGLIQEFDDSIRFGAMTFQYNGSASECLAGDYYCDNAPDTVCTSDADCVNPGKCTGVTQIRCPRVCSIATDIPCSLLPDGSTLDCPAGETCVYSTADVSNLDGAQIIHYISTGGTCATSGNPCVTDANCNVGEECNIPVGNHNAGLIRAIDDIQATTWTPFAEGFYNAIGYLAKEPTEAYTDPPTLGNSRNDGVDPDLRLNTADFDMDKNPSLYRCQTNNILLISDGMSTTDLNSDVDTFADLYDTDNQIGSCGDYEGSKNLDDLSWIARNRDIKTVATSITATTDEPAELSEQINTYVVYNGAPTAPIGTCSGSGTDCTADADCGGTETCNFEECDPQALMSQTAVNGGTSLYQPENPQELEDNLRNAFETISGKAASGTAASVLASGEGAGANLIQAIFYPKRAADGGICDDNAATSCTVDADCAVGEKCFDKNICGTDCSANGDADCPSGQVCLNSNRCVTPCTTNEDCPANEACLDEIRWTGTLHNFWYYLDPRLGDSTIREETATPDELTLDQDYIVEFFFDITDKTTKARRFRDTDGDGAKDETDGNPGITEGDAVEPAGIALDDVEFLWEAGELLWEREPMTRTIKTTLDTTSLIDFSTANVDNNTIDVAEFSLEMPDGDFSRGGAIGPDDAKILIEYVHGKDHTLLRPRAVGIDENDDGDTDDSGETNTWKLGDIVNATPRIVSWVPLNFYHRDYRDVTYRRFIDVNDGYCSVSSSTACTADADCNALSPAGQTCVFTPYRDRGSVKDENGDGDTADAGEIRGTGIVFTNANDGMLHAFKLGAFELIEDATKTKAKLHESGNALGYEEWAFVPKNVLPYLQYLTEDGYCHLYFVDQTPYVFDASIEIDETSDIDGSGTVAPADQPQAADSGCNKATNEYWNCKKTIKSWKTVLIGGMRLGGGCKNAYDDAADADTVAEECEGGVDFDNDGSVDNDDCVLTEDSVDANNAKGRTSYFALDITDPQNPSMMWEFTHPDLGFSTTGPAIIRISGRDPGGATSSRNNDLNGRWFVVFGSGPTGPVDTVNHQFMGFSDQDLRIFVLDVKTGSLLKTFDSIDHGVEYAFAGSLNNTNIDFDFDYQDDALYLGFTKSEAAAPTNATRWLKGGILRLITREDINDPDVTTAAGTTALDPGNWEVSMLLDEKAGVDTNIGPVTSSVAHLAFYPPRSMTPSRAFLYFGSGRYHYKTPGSIDDQGGDRALFGIREICLSNLLDPAKINTGTVCAASEELEFCDDPRNTAPCGDIFNATTSIPTRAQIDAATYKGWFINLDDEAGTIGDERVITDPLAAPTGAVFFTSFGPSNDLCEFGGDSFLWAVNFESGGSVADSLAGKALLQVSTGAIEEVDLKTALTEKGDRRTSAIAGIPPLGQGLNVIVPPRAIDRILHLKKE